MMGALLGSRLTIFRLAAVWSPDCPRVQRLTRHSRSGEPYHTYPNYRINITFTQQIGRYAKYVLDHDLHGIFHVVTTDMVNYFSLEKLACEALKIKPPRFVTETAAEEATLAILPSRKEIPDDLQMTVSDVLSAWS